MSERPFWQLSACDQAARLTKGEVSANEALEQTLDRVDAVNPKLNAIVQDLSDEARSDAKRLDEAFANNGPVGPLHGVPVTIKVNIDQTGHATTNGLVALKDAIAIGDAPVVTNLKKAGAVVFGRTNTPEFSFRGSTDNELHGRTFNPWNDWASAGGSSGGAGAAVMSGMGSLAHGNDIAGSVRYPSTANGATSVKPGLGRVPSYNPTQTVERGLMAQLMSVQSVLAREVRDVRLGLQTLVGFDPHDPWQVPLPLDKPFGDATDMAKPKIAFSKDTFEFDLHPAVEEALESAREALIKAGYEVENVEPPKVREIADEAAKTLFGEVKVLLDADVRRVGSADINRVFDNYYELTPPHTGDDLLRAMAKRSHYVRQWTLFLQDYPMVLSPYMPGETWAWDRDLQGIEGAREVLSAGVWSISMNYLGLPAGNVPANYNNGLPVGIQIIGRRFREDQVLDACEAIERHVGVMAEHLFAREGA